MKVDTFKKIERLENIHYKKEDDSSLSCWYDKISKKSFRLFNEGELSRTVRQDLYLKYVMPYVVIKLGENILAGELYEGELLHSLCDIRDCFWQDNKKYYEEIKALIQSNLEIIKQEIPLEIDLIVKAFEIRF